MPLFPLAGSVSLREAGRISTLGAHGTFSRRDQQWLFAMLLLAWGDGVVCLLLPVSSHVPPPLFLPPPFPFPYSARSQALSWFTVPCVFQGFSRFSILARAAIPTASDSFSASSFSIFSLDSAHCLLPLTLLFSE